jgi:hypothetical protein
VKLLPLLAAAAVVAIVVPLSLALRDDSTPGAAAGPSPSPTPDAERLWTGTATLLQTPGGDLTLCGGGILDSLPPAGCGGAKVLGLDPMTVEGAERFPNGTITTPSVKLTGTWDGKALTVTRPVEQPAPRSPEQDEPVEIPGPSCPEPEGGWPFDRFSQEGWERVAAYAAKQPDAGTPRVDKSQRIFTVPFTGDLDRHRAAIAKLYDGPVCVELVAHSQKELEALFDRAEADIKARGLQMTGGSRGGSAEPVVTMDLVAVTPEEKAELEKEYDGLLRLTSFLVRL